MNHTEQRKSRRRRPRRAAYIIGMVVCLAVMSGVGTVTLARYVGGAQSGWLQMLPEKFYFTSNVLESGGTSPVTQLYNWDQRQDYMFFMDIRNWADDFRITPGDIRYSVEIDAGSAVGVTGAVNGSSAADGGYLLSGGLANTQKLVITIPAGQIPAGKQVEVKVKAKPDRGIGYGKTLSGIFQLNGGAEACKVQVEAHNTYIDLLVGVDRGQTVTVVWPGCLTPDNTNRWIKDAVGASEAITLGDKESCRIRFFVTGTVGSGDAFRVTDAGGKVQTKPLK